MIWRIVQIEERVWLQWIIPSKICIILEIIRKLNPSIAVLLFIQNNIIHTLMTCLLGSTCWYSSSFTFSWPNSYKAGFEIKKIPQSPFGNQLEKYSRQMQIFSHQFVWCKWRSSEYGTIHQIWLFENIAHKSWYKFGGKLDLFMQFGTFFMMKARQNEVFVLTLLFNLNLNHREI